jgi:hypothetical protein
LGGISGDVRFIQIVVGSANELRWVHAPLQLDIVLDETDWVVLEVARNLTPNLSDRVKGGISLRHQYLPAIQVASRARA